MDTFSLADETVVLYLYHFHQYVVITSSHILYLSAFWGIFSRFLLWFLIWPGNTSIFHLNFYFFVVIICIFSSKGLCLIICRVRHLSDELRNSLLPFLVDILLIVNH